MAGGLASRVRRVTVARLLRGSLRKIRAIGEDSDRRQANPAEDLLRIGAMEILGEDDTVWQAATYCAGCVTAFFSSVTAVCARSRPLTVAPVLTAIMV